jgi:predicted RNase H-like HicB family nuclease
MKYHFKIHKEDDGSMWAQCLEINGCTTQSEDGTMENLIRNMEEVLNLCLEEPDFSDVEIPLPDDSLKGDNIVEVIAEPSRAFSVMFQRSREENGLSRK